MEELERLRTGLAESANTFIDAAQHFPEELRQEKPDAISFSATEILYHMLEVERLWQRRMRGMLDGTVKTFEALNPDEAATAGSYNEKSFESGIAEFRSARKETLDVLQGLSKEQFALSGLHPKYGELSMQRILEIMHGHDQNHTDQFRRTLLKLQATATK